MATTFSWKTNEDIDTNTRTIVKEVPVSATTAKTEFTLESKLNELKNTKQQVLDAQAKVKELEAEIAEIKTALSIK